MLKFCNNTKFNFLFLSQKVIKPACVNVILVSEAYYGRHSKRHQTIECEGYIMCLESAFMDIAVCSLDAWVLSHRDS